MTVFGMANATGSEGDMNFIYDDEAYLLERVEGGVLIEAQSLNNRGKYVEFPSPKGDAIGEVWMLDLEARRFEALFEILVMGPQGAQWRKQFVAKKGRKSFPVPFEIDSISMRVSITPLVHSDDPERDFKAASYWLGELRAVSEAERASELAQFEKTIAIAEKLVVRTKTRRSEVSDSDLRDVSLEIQKAKARLSDLKDDFSLKATRTEVKRVYDVCSQFESKAVFNRYSLVDSKASRETAYLYENLRRLSGKIMLFGMHDATGYGVGWRGDDDRSDVKDVCGDFPGIFSWDAFEVTFFENSDSLRYRMEKAYRMGGINTLCWHQYDPLGYGFYDKSPSKGAYEGSILGSLLPGGEHHEIYLTKLVRMGGFFKSLRGDDGEAIPVIFRPYHEHNGAWFWWGKGNCTPREYRELWQFTVKYLRDELGVHNLIYAFSPDAGQFRTEPEYFEIYPGDEYVDILGFDCYWDNSGESFKKRFIRQTRVLVRAARKRNMIAMLTEVGDRWDMANGGERLATTDWYTRCLLDSILTDEDTRGIVGAITWRNDNPNHHFAPYPGHPSVDDFMEFYRNPFTGFLLDTPDVYRVPD